MEITQILLGQLNRCRLVIDQKVYTAGEFVHFNSGEFLRGESQTQSSLHHRRSAHANSGASGGDDDVRESGEARVASK